MKKRYLIKNGVLVPANTLRVQAIDTTATLNPLLTALAAQFMRDDSGFVAEALLPSFPTAEQSATYYMFTAAELAQVAKVNPRAPGTPYPRLRQSLSNDNYYCRDYGIEAPVPDEERAKYGSYFSADEVAVKRTVDTIRLNREQRAYDLVTSAAVTSANIGVKWNDGASNPKVDADAAREAVRLQIGLTPNTLVISQPILNALSIHPKIVDYFKYTSPGVVTEDKLAAYFQIPIVKIAKAVVATNNEGQVFTPADIWGNNAVLAFCSPGMDLTMPNFGRTFYWTAFTSTVSPSTGGSGPSMATGGGGKDLIRITSYRDEGVKSDIHRSEHYVGEKLTAPKAGYVLTNVLG